MIFVKLVVSIILHYFNFKWQMRRLIKILYLADCGVGSIGWFQDKGCVCGANLIFLHHHITAFIDTWLTPNEFWYIFFYKYSRVAKLKFSIIQVLPSEIICLPMPFGEEIFSLR